MAKPVDEDERRNIARRAWLAYESLPREVDGLPPPERELERRHGLNQSHLNRLFKGERISRVDSMQRVARALGSSVDWIYFGKGERPIATGAVRIPPVDRNEKSGEIYKLIPELEAEIDRFGRQKLYAQALSRVRIGAAHIGSTDPNALRQQILAAQAAVHREMESAVSLAAPEPDSGKRRVVRR